MPNMASKLEDFVPLLGSLDTKKRIQLGTDILTYLANTESSLDCEDMGSFVDNISTWLNSSNFKVALNGLEILGILSSRLNEDFRHYISTVLPGATDRLGDAKDSVREQAKSFILNLANSVSSPQNIFDKLIPAFSHKNWRVREEILKCLQLNLERNGAHSLALSKLMPAIAKLVGDPNYQVRDTAVSTLVEIYRHVGERVKNDISKKYNLPAARIQMLFSKFDHVQNTGAMLPSAFGDAGHRTDDDTDSRSQHSDSSEIETSSGKTSIKRASSAPPARRSIFATPKPPAGSSSAAGAADQEMFIKSFEDVPRIQITSNRELEQEITRIKETLSDPNNDWEKRVEAIRRIRTLLLGGAVDHDLQSHLRSLEVPFQISVKDLRSQVVREACISIAFLSQQLGTRLDHFAEALLPSLINLIPNCAKIMSTAGIVTVHFIIQHTHVSRLVPILTCNTMSKSKDIRRTCCEFLDQLLHTWPTHCLEKHVSILQEAIKKGISDADPEARAFSRKSYWGFADHFKEQADNLLSSLDSSKQRMLQGELSMSTSSSNNSLSSTTKRANVYSSGSTESLSRSTTPASISRRSGIPQVTSPKSEPESKKPITLRSTSAIDLAAATRAKVRARASLTKGSGASLPRPNTKRAEMSGSTITSPERLTRMRSKSSSHSQPGSRPGSPSSKLSYATYQSQGNDHGSAGRNRHKSGIPTSNPSRDTSPVRNSYGGLERRGSFRSRLLTNMNDKSSTTSANSDIMSLARNMFQPCKESESAVSDMMHTSSHRKYSHAFEDQSDESETSSVCSDRSFTALGRNVDDVSEIVHNLSSVHWSDRKEGLLTLQALFHSSRLLTTYELKRVTDGLAKLFMDSHTKVFSLFMDVLAELILIYKVDLLGWLYTLLTRLIVKSGLELLTSVQTKIHKNLDLIRDSFPCEEQFAAITRFLGDPHQSPNTKAKVCFLQYLYALTRIMDPSEFSSTHSETKSAVSKIILWTTDHKNSEVRKLGEEVLVALFSLNAPEFSILLNQLPKNLQDSAFQLLNAQLRHQSNSESKSNSPTRKTGPISSLLKSPNASISRPHTIATQKNYSFEADDTENLNPEEFYNSLKKTTAEIQKYSMERIEQEYNGKDHRRLLGEQQQQQRKETTPQELSNGQESSISVSSHLSVPDGKLDILEERLEYPSSTDSSPNKRSPIEYNPVLYGNSDSTNRYDRPVGIAQEENMAKEGETMFYSIVSELNNHNSRNEQRKKALSHLINLTKEGSAILWEEHFRTVLRLLIETIEDSDAPVRAQALRALCELIRRQAQRFHGYIELTIIKILEAHRDKEREVLRAADTCSGVAVSVLPPEQCVRTLKPIIITAEFPASLAAVKMVSKLVDQYPKNILVQLLPEIMPALIKAFDNEESAVRKEAVFCTVAIHSLVGDDLKPHLTALSKSRMKLLNIYIKRAQAQTSSSSPGSPSNPTSSGYH